ncbi:MAG: NYN domain-containing protein, partial [Candidatus Aenigmarchaeota archaeon]|nr:NYN domain-containing protein [Candidatus Aenigmarchaeota archaeon]
MDKAAVLIDNGYFKRVVAALSAEGLDFEQFSQWLCKKVNAEWYRTYFYDCMPYQSNPPTEEERERTSRMDKFIYSLKKLPRFEIRLGNLIKLPYGGFKQKGVDIKLTIDLVKLSIRRDIQKAVLVACDSDFVPAVQEAKNEGVLVFSCFS